MANLELEIAAKQQIVDSLARSLEHLSWYDTEIEKKNCEIARLQEEILQLETQRENLPTSLAKAEAELKKLRKAFTLESNKELKELLKLKAKIDAAIAKKQQS